MAELEFGAEELVLEPLDGFGRELAVADRRCQRPGDGGLRAEHGTVVVEDGGVADVA